jgi:hypothetical protein
MPPTASAPSRRQHLEAVLLAFCCAVLFLREALLPGRALVPHPPELFDVVMAEAVAAGRFDAADTFRGNVGMTDKYLQTLTWDRVMQDRFAAGELPRWTNDIGGGAPFVPQMAQPWQPINLLLFVLPSEQWYGWWFLLHQVLFGWLGYVFFRRLGCGHAGALLGLVAAVLGLWTQCKLHHSVILTAALSLWPMLTATHELVAGGARGRARLAAIGWLALWTGLSWSTGFVVVALQVTYFTLALALLWALQAARGERWRRLWPVAAGLGLGAMAAAANMLPILLAKAASARGPWSAATQAELGLDWDHALAWLWPDLLSWASDRFYSAADVTSSFAYATRMPWSQLVLVHSPLRPSDGSALHSYVETAVAIGVLPLLGAVLALGQHRQRALVLGLWAMAIVAFGIATADPPCLGLARLIPGLDAGDLRRQLFAAVMALVVLGTLGLDGELRSGRRWPLGLLAATVGSVSAVALLWLWQHADVAAFTRGIAALIVADTAHPKVQAAGGSLEAVAQWLATDGLPGEAEHNRGMLLTTAWRTLLVAALGAAALRLPAPWRAAVWLALTIGELLHAGLGPVQTVPAERVTRLPAVLQPVAAAAPANGDRARLGRLLAPGALPVSALPGNLPGFLRLEDITAYNPLPPQRYEEFCRAIDAACVYGGAGVGGFRDLAAIDHPLCDLYGVRHLLTRVALPPSPTRTELTPPGAGGFRLYERTTALPRATFVQQVDLLPDATARLAALGARDRDVASRVVLEDPTAPPVAADVPAAASVTLVQRRDERVVVRVRTSAAGYLRLADPWHAGWRAALDGEVVPLYVADHYLRAVHVPAGEHEVVFTFDGAEVVWPLRLSLAAYAVVAWLLWQGRRRA